MGQRGVQPGSTGSPQLTFTITLPPEFISVATQIALRVSREVLLRQGLQPLVEHPPDETRATKTEPADHQFLTVKQASRLLQIGINQVYELVRQGQIQCIRLGAHSIRIPRAALEQWAKERTGAYGVERYTVQGSDN